MDQHMCSAARSRQTPLASRGSQRCRTTARLLLNCRTLAKETSWQAQKQGHYGYCSQLRCRYCCLAHDLFHSGLSTDNQVLVTPLSLHYIALLIHEQPLRAQPVCYQSPHTSESDAPLSQALTTRRIN